MLSFTPLLPPSFPSTSFAVDLLLANIYHCFISLSLSLTLILSCPGSIAYATAIVTRDINNILLRMAIYHVTISHREKGRAMSAREYDTGEGRRHTYYRQRLHGYYTIARYILAIRRQCAERRVCRWQVCAVGISSAMAVWQVV